MAPHAETPPTLSEPFDGDDIPTLSPGEGEEVLPQDDDLAMDSGDEEESPAKGEEEEEVLENDSIALFAQHTDSIFALAQHPTDPFIVAGGGGDDTVHIFSLVPPDALTTPSPPGQQGVLHATSTLKTHTDSVIALAFSPPDGRYLFSAGMDGRLCAYASTATSSSTSSPKYELVAQAREVEEITFLSPCPSPAHPNTVALGASDGSVWIYNLGAPSSTSQETELQIQNAYYLHTGPATAGSWTSTGALLVTVAEDSSFYAWDVFGEAASLGVSSPDRSAGMGGGTTQHVVGLTAADERFRTDGGLNSVAIAPNDAFAAAGGADGQIRIVGLPRISPTSPSSATASAKSGTGARSKPSGSKQVPGPKNSAASAGQAGQILAALSTQSESVETLSFSSSDTPLMAAGSVDGSIAVYDCARNFGLRRTIKEAHGGEAVIKVEFVAGTEDGEGRDAEWSLTSCGNDGVLRRWDLRGSANVAAAPADPAASLIRGPPATPDANAAASLPSSSQQQGLAREWKGHRGGRDGGGILDFVQGRGGGRYVVTAGDDGVALVFDTRAVDP